MAITSKPLIRSFSYNGVALQDPGCNLTLEEVRDVFSASFPEIIAAAIEGPIPKNGNLVYTFVKGVGTKG